MKNQIWKKKKTVTEKQFSRKRNYSFSTEKKTVLQKNYSTEKEIFFAEKSYFKQKIFISRKTGSHCLIESDERTKKNLGNEKNLYLQKKVTQQKKGNYFAEKDSYLSTVIRLFSRITGSEVILKHCPSSFQSVASILTMSSKKLSQEEFNGLQKSALYKIYSDLYDQKEDYRKIMEFIEKTSEADKDGKLQSTSTKAKELSKNVRNFSPFPVPEECVNLILGSSIIARVKTETFPNDTIVHAYRGSSTEEKIKVLDQYSEKKLKCVIIQDGTNSILKKNLLND